MYSYPLSCREICLLWIRRKLSYLRGGLYLGSLFLLASLSVGAQNTSHSYAFLDLPATPQSQAVGGLLLTYVGENPGLAFDNPALYGQESAARAYLSYMHYMQGIHVANALYGSGIGERATWAVGLRTMHYGEMKGYDAEGRPTQSFSAMDGALEALFSYDLTDKLRGGIALKAIYGQLERYSSLALASDVGLTYYNGELGTSWGISLSNIGSSIKSYGEPRETPPWDIRLGYSQKLNHAPFRVHTVLYGLTPSYLRNVGVGESVPRKIARHLSLGLEFIPSEKFWFAVGYNPMRGLDMTNRGGKSINGLSLGIGFQQKHYQIALSTALYHPQTMGFMLSVSTDFGHSDYRF